MGIEALTPQNVKGYWEEAIFHERGERESYNGCDHYLYSVLMDRGQMAETGTVDNMDPELWTFSSLELNRLQGSAPFATSNGLFGVFSDSGLLAGSTVCLFQGCRVPFVIGGGPEEYTLVGPCYLDPYIGFKQADPFKDLIILV